jgi:sporulation-control protein spo0M
MRKTMKQTADQESYMFLVTNLDPENEYVVFDVRGNTKGLSGLLHNCVERGNKQSN